MKLIVISILMYLFIVVVGLFFLINWINDLILEIEFLRQIEPLRRKLGESYDAMREMPYQRQDEEGYRHIPGTITL